MVSDLSINQGFKIREPIGVNDQQAGARASKDVASSLKAGDSVSGRIVDLTSNSDGSRNARVDMGGGNMLDARLSNSMDISKGQNILFTVRSASSGQVTLSPLYENTAALTATTDKALMAAGLAITDKLREMVGSMMKEGMGIDRNALLDMARTLDSYPLASPSVLVRMTSNEIPINETNIQQFTNYSNYEHQIISGMHEIADGIPEVYQSLTSAGDQDGALELMGDIIRLFGEGAEEGADEGQLMSAVKGEPRAQEGRAGIAGDDASAAAAAKGEEALQEAKAGVIDIGEGINSESGSEKILLKGEAADNGQGAGEIKGEEALAGQKNLSAGAEGKGSEGPLQADRLIRDLLSGISDTNSADKNAGNQAIKSLVGSPEFRELAGELLKDPSLADVFKGMLQGKMPTSSSDVINDLSRLFDQSLHQNDGVDKAWNRLFNSDSFVKALKETISDQWTLTPKEVGEKGNVDDLYRRLENNARRLTELFKDSSLENTASFKGSQNMQQNLDFMNQMNQMAAYVQLPLKMAGNEAHGDLYVYSGGKNAASEDGSVSALLHLDMAHLGPTDVYVKMKGDTVTSNFTLADEAAMDLIEAHIDELDARLKARGYNASFAVKKSGDEDPSNSALDEMLGLKTDSKLVRSTSFDARA
ncbi:flagellar hook-length control protein FliK [Butyrivibrio sp. MC2013]|uniref:flagellar hook-length control protein FliK n=1 Tax=Butyrivibrio sp. MC2013 TaxID=1280686 RepID=UPI00042A6F3D|nr:flagellar hook-length control protein FliK [Butyrivibrio sp. MC2013]